MIASRKPEVLALLAQADAALAQNATYPADVALARSAIAEAHAAVAELVGAGNRVIAAFRAIGNNKAPATPAALRIDAEQAILALDAALACVQGGAA